GLILYAVSFLATHRCWAAHLNKGLPPRFIHRAALFEKLDFFSGVFAPAILWTNGILNTLLFKFRTLLLVMLCAIYSDTWCCILELTTKIILYRKFYA